jgi:hypothetical protein
VQIEELYTLKEAKKLPGVTAKTTIKVVRIIRGRRKVPKS